MIELDVFGRNIARGCPVWIDLTGHSYVDEAAGVVVRSENAVFQHQVITYLEGGDVAIIGREDSSHYLDAANRKLINSWPVLARNGSYTAHRVLH